IRPGPRGTTAQQDIELARVSQGVWAIPQPARLLANPVPSAVGCAKSPCEAPPTGTALKRFCARGRPRMPITWAQARRPPSRPIRLQRAILLTTEVDLGRTLPPLAAVP